MMWQCEIMTDVCTSYSQHCPSTSIVAFAECHSDMAESYDRHGVKGMANTDPLHLYWAVQAGLLTPLPFTRHCVPWPLLLPVRTFFKMEGGDSEFAKFTLPTLKTFLKARS